MSALGHKRTFRLRWTAIIYTLSCLIVCFSEVALDDLMVIARQLRRPELPGEAERHLVVLIIHRGPRVDTHVESFVNGHDERNGVRDFPGGDVLIVHPQDASAAFAESRAIIFEVEHEGVLARCEGLLTFPAESFEVEEVIEKHRLALEQVQAIATEATTQGGEHSFGAALRYLHIRSDCI